MLLLLCMLLQLRSFGTNRAAAQCTRALVTELVGTA